MRTGPCSRRYAYRSSRQVRPWRRSTRPSGNAPPPDTWRVAHPRRSCRREIASRQLGCSKAGARSGPSRRWVGRRRRWRRQRRAPSMRRQRGQGGAPSNAAPTAAALQELLEGGTALTGRAASRAMRELEVAEVAAQGPNASYRTALARLQKLRRLHPLVRCCAAQGSASPRGHGTSSTPQLRALQGAPFRCLPSSGAGSRAVVQVVRTGCVEHR